jgi:hypothetical protein
MLGTSMGEAHANPGRLAAVSIFSFCVEAWFNQEAAASKLRRQCPGIEDLERQRSKARSTQSGAL